MIVRRSLVLGFAVAAIAAADSARAAPDCRCRYAGQFYSAGEYACIKTSKGFRLARCALSENVSTWRFLDKGCKGLSWRRTPAMQVARAIGKPWTGQQSTRP